MMKFSPTATLRLRASDWLVYCVLPLGWVAMLTGMFWVGDRSLYHKMYYGLVVAPAVLAMALQPTRLRGLASHPLFVAFVAFSAYMMLTLLWAPAEADAASLLKRPLYIGLLLLAAGLIASRSETRLMTATHASAFIAAAGAAVLLGHFVWVELPKGESRLSGIGALYNPLLTSHVLGAFAAYWMATAFRSPRAKLAVPLICFSILMVAILATGSRTPLVGLLLCFAWLGVGGNPRRGLAGIVMIAAVGIALALVYPDALLQRGLSYRPQIWETVLNMVAQRPWLGYGFDAPLEISVPGMLLTATDPHNIELGVLHQGGIIGLILWGVLYGVALRFCWRFRDSPMASVAGAWLVFGFGAGLFEGTAFLSRPKEHWLLIWLPMALVYGLSLSRRSRQLPDPVPQP